MLRSKWARLSAGIHSSHVFAIGDIHGHARPLSQALDVISQTPSGELPRHLVFLGDTIDHGPDNLETAQLVEQARDLARVDKVTRLCGNHEIMLALALENPEEHMLSWSINGGAEVIAEVDPKDEISSDAELVWEISTQLPDYLKSPLDQLPGHIRIDDIVFVHAGLSPHLSPEDFLALPAGQHIPGGSHWAWIREPFLDWKGGWNAPAPTTVVHGHSPATTSPYLDTTEIETLNMLHQSHQRINLDAGAGSSLSQIAMAEFRSSDYRIHIFHDPLFQSAAKTPRDAGFF